MKPRLGIIGGGQLGGLICQAAQAIGVETTVLTKAPEGLAVTHAGALIDAGFDDLSAIDALLAASDVITFELEDVPVETLQKLAEQDEVRIYPRPETMLLIQNKGLQKDWLVRHGFPTSDHLRFDEGLDAAAAMDRLGPDFVIKTQRGGYDGLGVTVVKGGAIPAGYEDVPTIAEALVQDFVEIAALVVRDPAGNTQVFPIFESIFDESGNVVRRVACPANVSADVTSQAAQLGCDIVNALEGVGVFAIEYFLTQDALLVNEIAPRVHNVGHLTIEASNASQFEQHVRAVMNMSPPSVSVSPAVMENLLYEASIATACEQSTDVRGVDGVAVHWYGKSAPRPLRKMGHLTAVAASVEQAARLADAAVEELRGQ
ncbi:MAG: ATP-grasp domain-containing protein [Gammaproteobacteria bacterium]